MTRLRLFSIWLLVFLVQVGVALVPLYPMYYEEPWVEAHTLFEEWGLFIFLYSAIVSALLVGLIWRWTEE